MRKAEIYLYNRFAGILIEDENGYSFEYDKEYLANTPERLIVSLVAFA
jgi:serine/threonine-protein kinase HipA